MTTNEAINEQPQVNTNTNHKSVSIQAQSTQKYICRYEPTFSLLTALSFTDESIEYFALTQGLFWMNSTVKVKIINVQMTHHKQN